jgi:putative FmdB family regulatory protein
MPLYDYACTKCGRTFEVRRGFNEIHEDPCAACGAPLRRVFNAAPVLFKGSGFYVTDSRGSAPGSKAEKPEKPEKPEKTEKQKAPSEGSTLAASAPAESAPAKSESKKASEPAA